MGEDRGKSGGKAGVEQGKSGGRAGVDRGLSRGRGTFSVPGSKMSTLWPRLTSFTHNVPF